MKKISRIALAVLAIIPVFSVFFSNANVYADDTNKSTLQTAIEKRDANALADLYEKGGVNDGTSPDQRVKKVSDIITTGNKDDQALITNLGITSPEQAGYTPVTKKLDAPNYTFQITDANGNTTTSNSITITNLDSNGNITQNSTVVIGSNGPQIIGGSGKKISYTAGTDCSVMEGDCSVGSLTYTIEIPTGKNAEEFINGTLFPALRSAATGGSRLQTGSIDGTPVSYHFEKTTPGEVINKTDRETYYVMNDAAQAAKKLAENLGYSDLNLTSEEQQALYQYYLTDHYNLAVYDEHEDATSLADCFDKSATATEISNMAAGGYTHIDGTGCFYKKSATDPGNVVGEDGKEMDLDDVIDAWVDSINAQKTANCRSAYELDELGNKKYSVIVARVEGAGPNDTITDADQALYDRYKSAASKGWVDSNGQCIKVNLDDDDLNKVRDDAINNINTQNSKTVSQGSPVGGEEPDLDECMKSAQAMGWAACPILFYLRDALKNMYDGFIVPALQINSDMLGYGEGNDVFKAWAYFRDFANIVFVFILLFVIFSQVTGFGIDNYGVKKTLPKLIIGAILINLSFFVCQFAVDISNLVGSGIEGIFTNIAYNLSDANVRFEWMDKLLTFLVGAVGTGTVAITTVTVLGGGWAVLLPLLLSLLSGVIAVLFMFVLLSVRQAGIIMLVVISPIALVLYILPNTGDWAKRWWKAFSTLLLMYPICGLVVGGSYLVASIIIGASGENFTMYLIAMLISVVPFFFIPSIIKMSMSAFGTVGAKISGLGSTLGRGATGAIRGTEAYKRSQVRARTNLGAFDPGGIKGKAYTSRIGKYLPGRRGYTDNLAAKDEQDRRDVASEVLLRDRKGPADMSDLKKGYTDAIKKGDSFEASVNAARMSNIDNKDASKFIVQQALDTDNLDDETARNQLLAIQASLAQNKNASDEIARKDGDVYNMIQSTGRNNNVRARSGLFTKEMTQRLESSNLPSMSTGALTRASQVTDPTARDHFTTLSRVAQTSGDPALQSMMTDIDKSNVINTAAARSMSQSSAANNANNNAGAQQAREGERFNINPGGEGI